jgi:hypothetical protein
MSTAALTPSRLEWHSMPRRTRYAISLVCAIASLWIVWHANSPLLAGIAAAFAFASVAALADQNITLDPTHRQVTREITLLGWRLRSTQWPLDQFTAIRAYRLPAGTPQAPAELCHVGLQRASGSIIAVRYFPTRRGAECPEAEAFARELAATTGLAYS